MKKATLLVAAALALATRADEGMWTFNGFPSEAVGRKYGFAPDERWLERARLSSVRLAQGCSASFVSAAGLVMTNHHCARKCIEQLSAAGRDLVRDGFYARSQAEELRCPELEVNQLLEITDVTARMEKATRGLLGQAFGEAGRAEAARIEKECQTSAGLRCDVVALHRGGRHDLYRYRRHQDVRLVFAPESAIAFFGGDPDNFMFPRYDLDVAFLRVYESGSPAATPAHLGFSAAGPRQGDLVFVAGHPGATSRQKTAAQLAYQRDTALPEALLHLAWLRGLLTEYRHRGPEQARHASGELFYVENSMKARLGRLEALHDPAFFGMRVAEEERLRADLARGPEAARGALAAFEVIARAEAEERRIRVRLGALEGEGALLDHPSRIRPQAFGGELFKVARILVRGAEERSRPVDRRLREYRDAALPALTQRLFSPAPIHAEYEVFHLTHSLGRMRELLGPDDPLVRKVLGRESPAEVAARLVRGTRLSEVAVRRALWEGGRPAVEAAARQDAMLELALRVDADSRAVRTRYEDGVEAVRQQAEEQLARARFAVRGTAVAPDATFSLRLSYGAVRGWEEEGRRIPAFTTLAGAFERHTGHEPFALPESWLAARDRLDMETPFNFVSDNDVIGGNSGSPIFNRDLEVVGAIFDGNIRSLAGEYGFDEASNRAVSVDSAAILEALDKIYRAERVVRELRPRKLAGK